MALTPYTTATNIIGVLGTTPQERALTTQEFKDKFDQNAVNLVAFMNGTTMPEIDRRKITAKTAAYTVLAADLNIDIPCTGTFTVTFPLISTTGFGTGFRCRVVNISTGVITVASTSTDTIAGAASVTVAAGKSIEVVADAAGIWTVHGFDFTSHIDNTTTAHGAVSAATASKIIIRDASGRAKVAAPAVADDIATKAEADAATGQFKVGFITHDLSVAGDQAAAGIGFQPKAVFFLTDVDGAAGKMSIGATSGGAANIALSDNHNTTANSYSALANACIHILNSSGNYTDATLKSLDSDGFTVTWAKTGTGATGTATILYLAMR